MQPAHKVALNTGIQYARVVITMGISLYATRLVLQVLGSTDYGIFNLVAGVIALFAFFNAAMTTSTQRYLSFHQGKEDMPMQKKVFSNSLLMHGVAGLLIVAGLVITGFFLFNGFLNIPHDRLHAARLVYYFISVSVFFNVVSMPFIALLLAHENILWIALLNTAETVLKLAIALLLPFLSGDRLMIYGLLMATLSVFSFAWCALYCSRKYEDCSIQSLFKKDTPLIKELTAFAGWNLFGALCSMGRYEGLAILLNIFFGTIVNAAFGIANQVAAQLGFFSATLIRAINPQIMKSEGAGDRQRMLRLSMTASKFGFFLLAAFAVPFIFEMPSILKIWLKEVPDNTIVFCSLVIAGTLVNQLTIGLESALQAVGRIRVYQLIVGLLLLCNVPVAYALLARGFPAYYAFVTYASIELLACGMRIYLAKKITGLAVPDYFSRVLARELVPLISIIATCFIITQYEHFSYRFLLTGIASFFIFMVSIYLSGLCADEKIVIHQVIDKFKHRLIKKRTSEK